MEVFLVQLACLLNSHFIILIQKNNLRKLARIWLEDWEKWKTQLQRSYDNKENNDTNLKESKYSFLKEFLWILSIFPLTKLYFLKYHQNIRIMEFMLSTPKN